MFKPINNTKAKRPRKSYCGQGDVCTHGLRNIKRKATKALLRFLKHRAPGSAATFVEQPTKGHR